MLNTLGIRTALGEANRRKLSFRNVSNVVVQLLHTIKYSVPAPFSHLATTNGVLTNSEGAAGPFNEKNTRQVRADTRVIFKLNFNIANVKSTHVFFIIINFSANFMEIV